MIRLNIHRVGVWEKVDAVGDMVRRWQLLWVLEEWLVTEKKLG